MAHDRKPGEKVVFVGDSRVRLKTERLKQPDYSAYPGKSEAFIPNFLLKEWMVGVVVLVGILALVMSEPAPLGYPADPTNTAFIPMPDWYFLFLYQFLKYPYTSDHYVVFGTVLVPGLAFLGLMLVPFLDLSPERRFYRRPVTSALMIVTLLAMGYLTYTSWHHYKEELKEKNIIPEDVKREEELRAAKGAGKAAPSPSAGAAKKVAMVAPDDPGAAVFKKATCVACHGGELKGMPSSGIPALLGIGDTLSKDDILGIIKNGKGNMPAQYKDNIGKGLTDADIDKLANWLSMQKSK
ncbi:menaquinol-cytochrome C reductase [Gordoniibacillus kamchatkensis]|uniref:Menaquinol-cytochrome C reductase n=1 Tax=Gordoniibacillus kamchatkensis TaxID=1590651 RepID=A0ABR5AKT5_9BACL|nr:c-type cytochrome [Paenibacillus sp. VKM B-2647]KIL41571.1 menaquinol-cytochrome C reductase [Paenibacillus sp. VKM B-2647]